MTEARAAYRVDGNQAAIVRALRRIGATVTITAGLGRGFPDLVAGYHGINYLIEVKIPGEQLTRREREWHETWRGNVFIAYTPEHAVEIVTTNPMELQS